jgi:hypothetical protein
LAQWQWIDKDGRKVYSDRSPPSDIQEKNILKRPAAPKIRGRAHHQRRSGRCPPEASAPGAKTERQRPKHIGQRRAAGSQEKTG